MQSVTTVRYQGTWRYGTEDSEAGSLWKSLPAGLGSDLKVEVVIFKSGDSVVRAVSGEKTLFVSARDKNTQFLFKPAENKVVFTPLESNPLPPFYGFILPSNLTEQFTRSGDTNAFAGQKGCEPGEADCQSWIVDLGNGGMPALVAERQSGYDYSLTYQGKTGSRREWRFAEKDSEGFPKGIEYREYRLESKPVAHVSFELLDKKASQEESNFRALLPEDVKVELRKDNVSYGGGIDKDSTTLWQTYEAQEAMHSQVAEKEQSVFPLVAAVTLLVGIVAFVIVILIRKRRGK
ncbi:MAG: hypothetical protein LCH41_06130 [Armatimonadetes bacterium]|nr:hypothetical protein [Armatimonadota bacterium]